MKICPHCGKLPPTLWPQFGVYAVLTIIAIVCAVYFRPFLNGPAIGEVSQGVLWVAVIIFIVFAVIFLGVSVERERFVKMKQHIEAKRHFYEKDIDYCTVCGNKKPAYMNKSK